MSFRVGFGYDVHRLSQDRKLILGGVTIPYDKGLEGHSDADVLLHAICDALLGSLALGDIGVQFPDSQEEYKGISSMILLAKVAEMIDQNGYVVGNIDTTIVAESPKILPYSEEMRMNISDVLNCSIKQVSIKATTTEKLGFTGKGEGISAYAIALLSEKV